MLISLRTAREIVLRHVRPLKAIRKSLTDVAGCCLAEDVRADRDLPPADRSAMDGYAVRSDDLSSCPCKLRLVGEVAAGSSARPKVRPGCCVRVLTGANVPPGADTVVMVEQTSQTDDVVTIKKPVEAGANIRKRGEEAAKGAILLTKGTLLGPAQIGLCASVGKAGPRVHPRPRVAVLCTGEELRDATQRVQAHELRDSNGPALQAALRAHGCAEATHQVVPDDPTILASMLRQAAVEHDVIVLTGGVSVGKYDYVPDAVTGIGAIIRFHGVRMKPGKPGLYATLRGRCHIFGLPGNPLSVLTGFHEFVLPALRRMSGVAVEDCRPSLRVPLSRPVCAKSGRTEFMLARLVWDRSWPSAIPLKSHGSADLVAGTQADGAVVIPANVRELPAGTLVEFRPWRALP